MSRKPQNIVGKYDDTYQELKRRALADDYEGFWNVIHDYEHERLKETGMDPKWPRKAGSQIRFVAESMAGAEWDLTPSTSREFIREQKPGKSAIPAQDQRWWEPSSGESKKADN